MVAISSVNDNVLYTRRDDSMHELTFEVFLVPRSPVLILENVLADSNKGFEFS